MTQYVNLGGYSQPESHAPEPYAPSVPRPYDQFGPESNPYAQVTDAQGYDQTGYGAQVGGRHDLQRSNRWR